MTRKPTKILADLRPGDIVRGTVHECPQCAVWFIARADAVYCCNACRVAASRERDAMVTAT